MKGWRSCPLEEVVRFIDYRGRTPKKTESGMRLITAKNVKTGYLQIEPREFVDPDIYDEWMTRGIPKKGDVLFTTEAPLGNVAQLDTAEKVVFAQRIIVMQPDRKVLDATFLKYLLLSGLMQKRIHEQGTGATVKGIKAKLLKKIPIPFPASLAEQKQIVAILDEAFEGIDSAIANTEKNLANARKLFESYLNAIFTHKGDGWAEKTLQEILSVQPRNGWSPPAKNHSDTGIPVLTLSSVTGFQFGKDKVKYTSAPTKPDAHYWLKDGEFLITRSNTRELVGHVAICEGLTEPTICCDLIMKMQVDSRQADRRFIYWHYRTREMRELISSSAQGANPTMRKINKSIVQNLPIALPDLATQQDLVEKIDALEAETQRLEAIYQQKLAALNELKQSILQKAFSGELTDEVGDAAGLGAEAMEAA